MKFKELTPSEQQAAIHRAVSQLQTELITTGPAIGRLLDEINAEVDTTTGHSDD